MPTYDYRCRKCGHRYELFHSIKDEAVKRCPKCRGRAERVPAGGAGLLFKGSGFYITDYRSRSYQEGAKKEGAKQEGGKQEGAGQEKSSGAPSTEGSSGKRTAGEGGAKKSRGDSAPDRKSGGSASRPARRD